MMMKSGYNLSAVFSFFMKFYNCVILNFPAVNERIVVIKQSIMVSTVENGKIHR